MRPAILLLLIGVSPLALAEAFIENAAAVSSSSGKPDLVKCGDVPLIQGKIWFSDELRKYRATAGPRR